MKNNWIIYLSVISILIITGCKQSVNKFNNNDKLPDIFPDYTSLTIPSNIAPLNFNINETGEQYAVEIYSENGNKIFIRQKSPKIIIPINKWHKLLDNNKGNVLKTDVYVKNKDWTKYKTITDTIANELIDNNLVYRTIGIVYTYYNKLGIYQRNIENFDVSAIYENTSNEKQPCMNCHSFCNNKPDKMSVHFRRYYSGTVIYNNGVFNKFNTKTKYTMAPASYTAWHPGGNLLAYTVCKLHVSYTSDKSKIVEVWDKTSDLIVYDVLTNTVTTSPKISTHSRENLPFWSPDGKWLYFTSAPKVKDDLSNIIFDRYDLLRIRFNPEDLTWGDIDTVLTSKQTGKSITFPSVSPDGRYILFTTIDHSYFSIFDKKSDLYLLDLEKNTFEKAETLNSNSTDSYHTWSKNGRWVVFSSKRIDDITTRPYFSYFDKDGNFHKPFVLPQKDPLYYLDDTRNVNIPTLVNGKVKIRNNEMRDFIKQNEQPVNFDKNVDIDALSGATWIKKQEKL